jgi:hypothetical protein
MPFTSGLQRKAQTQVYWTKVWVHEDTSTHKVIALPDGEHRHNGIGLTYLLKSGLQMHDSRQRDARFPFSRPIVFPQISYLRID